MLLPKHLIVHPAELAPLPGDEATRRRERSLVAAVADGGEAAADPDLTWIDSRVPMVHVPLRRPPSP